MSTLALWRDKLAYQPVSLGVVAMLSGLALVVANTATQPGIAAAEQRDLQSSLEQVLPAGFASNDLLSRTHGCRRYLRHGLPGQRSRLCR